MSQVQETIDIDVPTRVAYNQWTQFEEFPQFMSNVSLIEQIDDTHQRWTAEVGGQTRQFDVEIVEQRPDERIAWNTTSGLDHAGVATFHRLDEGKSRLAVQLDFEPEGIAEKAADATGLASRAVKSDLENFKQFIEKRGFETGAWREEVAKN